jgi:hypothetical protein
MYGSACSRARPFAAQGNPVMRENGKVSAFIRARGMKYWGENGGAFDVEVK